MVHQRLKDFDHIIILDSCRYDYFARVVGFFPELSRGDLALDFTEACNTGHFYRTYVSGDWSEYILFSMHPGLNSTTCWAGYSAWEHFRSVVDLWKEYWIDELHTCDPTAILHTLPHLQGYLKTFIHFVQPHGPHPTLAIPAETDPFLSGANAQARLVKLGKIDIGRYKQAYLSSLLWALSTVNILVTKLEGLILVTADHGELLGEEGRVWHDVAHPLVSQIPTLTFRRK